MQPHSRLAVLPCSHRLSAVSDAPDYRELYRYVSDLHSIIKPLLRKLPVALVPCTLHSYALRTFR